MPNVTIYLPDDLAAAVKGAGISVSPLCQRALEQEVKRMKAAVIEDEDIAKAAQRLAAAESEEVNKALADGRDWGREWALNWASPQELRKMEALTREPGMWLGNRMRAYVGEGISLHDEAEYESIRQLLFEGDSEWSLDGYAEDAVQVWWEAFEDAALETYEKVQEAMRTRGRSGKEAKPVLDLVPKSGEHGEDLHQALFKMEFSNRYMSGQTKEEAVQAATQARIDAGAKDFAPRFLPGFWES